MGPPPRCRSSAGKLDVHQHGGPPAVQAVLHCRLTAVAGVAVTRTPPMLLGLRYAGRQSRLSSTTSNQIRDVNGSIRPRLICVCQALECAGCRTWMLLTCPVDFGYAAIVSANGRSRDVTTETGSEGNGMTARHPGGLPWLVGLGAAPLTCCSTASCWEFRCLSLPSCSWPGLVWSPAGKRPGSAPPTLVACRLALFRLS